MSENIKTRYVKDGKGTAYTIMVVKVENEELAKVGFHSGLTLYCAFTSGNCVAHYNKFKVKQKLPGNAEWITDEFYKLEGKL